MSVENSAAQAVCTAKDYSPIFGFNLEIPAGHLAAAIEHPDAIQTAVELGRLDFVASILAVLGIMIGLGAVFGFWTIRGAAKHAAEKAAREEIRELVPKEIRTLLPNILSQALVEVLREDPTLIGAALRHDPSTLLSVIAEAKETFFGDIEGGEADAIATMIDEGGENGST